MCLMCSALDVPDAMWIHLIPDNDALDAPDAYCEYYLCSLVYTGGTDVKQATALIVSSCQVLLESLHGSGVVMDLHLLVLVT